MLVLNILGAAGVTLPEVWESARKSEIQIEDQILTQRGEQRSQLVGEIFPTLGGRLDFNWMEPVKSGGSWVDSHSGRLYLRQPIFRGFREFAALRKSEILIRASEEGRRVATNNLFLSIAASFYEFLSANWDYQSVVELAELTQTRINELERRVRIGKSRETDLLLARAQNASALAQKTSSRVRLDSARARFRSVTGIMEDLTPTLSSQPAEMVQPLNRWIDKLNSHPELTRSRELEKSFQEDVVLVRGRHFPTIDLAFQYYPYRTGTLKDTDWDFGISLDIPIFQGGAVAAGLREAHSKMTEQTMRTELLYRKLKEELTAKFLRMQGIGEEHASFEMAAKLAQKSYERHRSDFHLGLVSNLEVIQSLTQFIDAKRNWDRVRAAKEQAFVELRFAAGSGP